MRAFGRLMPCDRIIRKAESGPMSVKRYKPKENAAKSADIARCLACERRVCTGCASTHEGKWSAEARKRRRQAG